MDSEQSTPEGRIPESIPLHRSRRLNFERRLRLWLSGVGGVVALLIWLLLRNMSVPGTIIIITLLCLAVAWAFAVSLLMEEVTRPLQTLANVVAALRMDDFSFRARGGLRNDSMGDLALELNKLADTLQAQRTDALEAVALADRVMAAMQAPLLAFDPEGGLRLMNAAAERAFRLHPKTSIGQTAEQLGLASVLEETDGVPGASNKTRWLVTRSSFRLQGVPHRLFVLSDIGAALREEERIAWERLVRVLGHEINNSLTPIKSIAGSLRQQLSNLRNEDQQDFHSGLEVIESRADSLNRFLQAYRQLLRLPPPVLQLTPVAPLVHRVAQLETRLQVRVVPGGDLSVPMDEIQIQQALINLVRNATEAALSPDAPVDSPPEVEITWQRTESEAVFRVQDSGPGLSNQDNLFVPFYTTKQDGSGIGLILSQQIVHAHQGTVSLINRKDGRQGCIATLRLPLGS